MEKSEKKNYFFYDAWNGFWAFWFSCSFFLIVYGLLMYAERITFSADSRFVESLFTLYACISLVVSLWLVWGSWNINKIISDDVWKFLTTLEGRTLLMEGFVIVPFMWIDYEYAIGDRYIKIGTDRRARYFRFDYNRDDGFFEETCTMVRKFAG